MSTPGSYDIREMHRDTESEIQRLRAQALYHWKPEAAALVRLGLQDGMTVLEPGSGPGFVTEQLLHLVPSGSVTALEIDPMLVERAQQYLQDKVGGRVRIVQASVMETGLPDNSFDFAYARLLFQHLPDPVGAARELLRVLKPGGRLVIGDVDDKFVANEPVVPEGEILMEKLAQVQAARGGNRFIARGLIRLLKEAGYRNSEMEAVVSHTDITGIEAMLPQIDPDMLLRLVRMGVLSEDELNALRAARETFLASDPLMMRVFFLAGGQKPNRVLLKEQDTDKGANAQKVGHAKALLRRRD